MINESNRFPNISLLQPEVGMGVVVGPRGGLEVRLKDCKYASGPADLSSS